MADSKGVAIFCLQEVVHHPNQEFIVTSLLKRLGKDWSAQSHVDQGESWLGMGTCIIWNQKKLHLQKTEKILLPINQHIALHESIFFTLIAGESLVFPRRAIIGTFKFQNTSIRVTNIHLDHIGGPKQRKKQLVHLRSKLGEKTPYDIICGDFNTFDLLKSGRETEALQATLGAQYEDVSKNSGWTADLYNVNFDRAFALFKFFIRFFRIHVRRKLDYIWAKGLTKVSLEKLDLTGSDHLPLIATLTQAAR